MSVSESIQICRDLECIGGIFTNLFLDLSDESTVTNGADLEQTVIISFHLLHKFSRVLSKKSGKVQFMRNGIVESLPSHLRDFIFCFAFA